MLLGGIGGAAAGAEQRLLQAAANQLERENYGRAAAELARVDPSGFDSEARFTYMMLRARLALGTGLAAEAVALLETVPAAANPRFSGSADYHGLLAQARLDSGDAGGAAAELLRLGELFPQQAAAVEGRLWQALEFCNAEELDALAAAADSYSSRGWVELARLSQSGQFDIAAQLESLRRWQQVWNRHPATENLPPSLAGLEEVWRRRPRHVALLLPLQEPAGKAIHEGFLSAYYQLLDTAGAQGTPRISVFDSSGRGSVGRLYDEAVASGADLIIGPLDKGLVNQLRRRRRLEVATLALNYADGGRRSGAHNLYQFGLAPEDEIAQAVELAWNAGHRNAALLTPDSTDYRRLQDGFAEAWRARGGNLVARAGYADGDDYTLVVKRLLAIDSSESRRVRLMSLLPRTEVVFTPRGRADIDFIFLIANPRQGRQLKPTLGFYFAENLPVYSMPSIYDGVDDPTANRELEGIIFTDAPWVLGTMHKPDTPLKSSADAVLRPSAGSLQRLRAMGADGFRLHSRIGQLAEGEVSALHGVTGMLTLQPGNRIRRHLQAARFEDGRAVLYEP